MKKRIVAYVSDWAFTQDLKKEQADCLTHINYAFGHIADGEVSVGHLAQMERLLRTHEQFPQLKINLSVGGWGADGFSEAVETADGREKLAESTVKLLKKLPLTGIDWDWEYPGSADAGIVCSPNDPENMTSFLVLMREKLKALGSQKGCVFEQSIAVGGGRTQDYLWEKAVPVLDSINLMTYDMGMGENTGHVTNLMPVHSASFSVDQSVRAFHEAGVPKEKLLIGAAFYYHVYEGVDEGNPFGKPYQRKADAIPHDELPFQAEACWDDQAKASYYKWGNCILSGDDERSLEEKRTYIQHEGLGGTIIWELNHDRKNLLLPHLLM